MLTIFRVVLRFGALVVAFVTIPVLSPYIGNVLSTVIGIPVFIFGAYYSKTDINSENAPF